MKFDKKIIKIPKLPFFTKKVLEKYREVLEKSLKSPGILYLKKCGNHVLKIKCDIKSARFEQKLTSILSNQNNFHSLEVVDRVSETHLQVSENYN